MREILFRGRGLSTGAWHYGYYGNCRCRDYITTCASHWIEVIPETVGQYTGLTDTNGKQIFEGDIVEGRSYDEEDGYGVVEWIDGAFYVHNDSWCGTFFENYNGHDFEVIGNIHDNPELIGGKEE